MRKRKSYSRRQQRRKWNGFESSAYFQHRSGANTPCRLKSGRRPCFFRRPLISGPRSKLVLAARTKGSSAVGAIALSAVISAVRGVIYNAVKKRLGLTVTLTPNVGREQSAPAAGPSP